MVLLIQENVDFRLKDDQLVYLLEISDTVEWQRLFCKLLSVYYCASKSFNQADLRFQQIISPRLGLFDKETLPFLLECIESNNQVYLRGKAIEDHRQIKDRLLELYGSDFDLVPYPHFNANTMEE
jgi:hypothetical protein